MEQEKPAETPNLQTEPLTPAELIKKHIADPGHVVTDEEVKSLKVGNEAEKGSEFETEKKIEKIENIVPDRLPNPYDILGG